MRDEYSQPFAVAQDGASNLIAGVFGDVLGGAEVAAANARLIAAAPLLRDALRALVDNDDAERRAGTQGYAAGSPMAKRWNAARSAIKASE